MGLRTLPGSCNMGCSAATGALWKAKFAFLGKLENKLGSEGGALDIGRMAGAGDQVGLGVSALGVLVEGSLGVVYQLLLGPDQHHQRLAGRLHPLVQRLFVKEVVV